MKPSVAWKMFSFLVAAALVVSTSCRHTTDSRPYREPPPSSVKPTTLEYTDADAFDALFESALVNQDAVIVIRTGREKPDWDGRLNAWIAAWNLGGKVAAGGDRPKVRGQAPLPKVVDGDSIREFRLLVESLMDRVEVLARGGAAWWAEERVRSRRIALLRPYNLHFHLAEDQTIQLIFFNGRYAEQIKEAVPAIADAIGDDEPHGRPRCFTCSRCKCVGRAASGFVAPDDAGSHPAQAAVSIGFE
jgi:hypothetical protein